MSVSAQQPAQAAPPSGASATQPFPWNRVATLLGPFVAAISGAVAAWLLRHFPGVQLDQTTLATTISEAVVFSVTALGTFALHHKWLTGWQHYEQSLEGPKEVARQVRVDIEAAGAQGAAGRGAPEPAVAGQAANAGSNGQPADEQPVDDAQAGDAQAGDAQAGDAQAGDAQAGDAQLAAGNGQPANGGQPDGSPAMRIIDAVLPTLRDELASSPPGQEDGNSETRPESAVKPDQPVDELAGVGDDGPALGNGQPADGPQSDQSPAMAIITAVLPTLMEELASSPVSHDGGDATTRPESAMKPDEPVNELQGVGV